jgi:hypothetical protein
LTSTATDAATAGVKKHSAFGIKSDFRLGRNFLKGQVGDAINLLLAAAASSLSLWMSQILFALVSAIQNWAREYRTFCPPLPA